jgi:hypothetical protein
VDEDKVDEVKESIGQTEEVQTIDDNTLTTGKPDQDMDMMIT